MTRYTALIGVIEQIRVDPAQDPERLARLRTSLRDSVAQVPRIRGLFVYDARGDWTVNSLQQNPPNANNADRAYFQYHRDNDDPAPYIREPVLSRSTAEWVITISRRLNNPAGNFAGVVLASVPLSYFIDFYNRLDVGLNGAIALLRTDGVLLVRRPFDNADIGRNLASNQTVRDAASGSVAGTGESISPIDGVARIIS